ncbi:MAG TPA: penicillin-binding protein 2 [Rhodanobacteraceae bacterium]|nr:penicillin-binding protein 2 [Rhodanobacteraceae bacterium]
MTRRAIKDNRRETALFRRRVLAGFGLILVGLAVVLSRFFWLQVVEHGEYVTRATQNRVHLRHLAPARGLIYDRHGRILADNVPAFRLEVVPERVKHVDAMLDRLQQVVPLSSDDIKRFHQQLRQHRSFQSVPLKFDLDQNDIARFAVNRWRFPGVDVVPYLTRNYPMGRDFAHIIGYVARIDPNDLKGLDADLYDGTTHIGKTGLERYYETVLHGKPGYELVEVNADQRPLRVLERHPPQPGTSLYLTIDARLQQATVDALGDQAGAAVAIDPRNGEVLAMVSNPAYDPNLFVNGISQTDYSALLHDPDNPLMARAMRGQYPPGSTVKPFLGLGGLIMGLRTPQDKILSTGTWYLPGNSRGYRDDKRWGSGWVNLEQAIEQSVNTYFYALANDMGIDRLSSFMARFGFGEETGIDLRGESSGILPSREWKSAHSRNPWYPGETVIAGIGQGYWAVTPLQLAHAVATLADHGVAHAPHLLYALGHAGQAQPELLPAEKGRQVVAAPDEAWAAVQRGMLDVVNGAKGTASGLGKGFPYLIAGKTGTSERFSRTTTDYESGRSIEELARLHHALFIAYTPVKHPRIAVAVVIDNGAWGSSAAAPVARQMLDAWLREQPPPVATLQAEAGAP